MLKTLTALSALAILLAAPASAETLFRGTITFTKKNSDCNSSVKVGDTQKSQFHPSASLVATNNDFSAVNRITDYSALSWARDGALSSSFQEVSNKSVAEKTRDPSPKTFLKLTSVSPASMDENTANAVIKGQVKNPFGQKGQGKCVVDFVAAYINEFNN